METKQNKLLTGFILLAVLTGLQCTGMNSGEISPARVKEKLDAKEDILLLDVRTPEVFVAHLGHIPGAKLIPLSELDQRIDAIKKLQNKEIILYCSKGIRSARAVRTLKSNGIFAKNMIGGMEEWNKLAYPVCHKFEVDNEFSSAKGDLQCSEK
jgi:rhodanese-related sulfurtransferase